VRLHADEKSAFEVAGFVGQEDGHQEKGHSGAIRRGVNGGADIGRLDVDGLARKTYATRVRG
jgi:hypothetical protein